MTAEWPTLEEVNAYFARHYPALPVPSILTMETQNINVLADGRRTCRIFRAQQSEQWTRFYHKKARDTDNTYNNALIVTPGSKVYSLAVTGN